MSDTIQRTSFAKTLRAIFLGVALLALSVACAGYLLLSEIRRPAGNDATPVEFIVEPGDSASVIATRLGMANLIRQPLLFTLLVRMQGLDSELQAGRYLLRANMTMSEIIAALQNSRVEEVQVTIIEGSRLEEIAEQIAAAGLVNVTEQAFLRTARNGAAFQPQHFYLNSLPPGASLEGYLFPDTYRFAVTATVTEVIEIMLDRFDEQYATFEREVTVNVSIRSVSMKSTVLPARTTHVSIQGCRPDRSPVRGLRRYALLPDPTHRRHTSTLSLPAPRPAHTILPLRLRSFSASSGST
jgi:UPF0755 protein